MAPDIVYGIEIREYEDLDMEEYIRLCRRTEYSMGRQSIIKQENTNKVFPLERYKRRTN